MAKIRNITYYPLETVDGVINGYVIGSQAASGATRNYSFMDVHTAFKELEGTLSITLSDVDNITLYDYHGGMLFDGESWVVLRYLKSDLTKTNAQRLNDNLAYLTLEDAWTNRETLTYNT